MRNRQEDNLRWFGRDRSQSEARELGRKGGIRSGKKRREQRQLKDLCQIILNAELTDNELREDIEQNIPELAGEVTNGAAMLIQLLKLAMAGDTKAFEILRDTAGEKPSNRQEVELMDGEPITIYLDGEPLE